ncbi:MAG: anaerobic ribonucleoside-triphosphate reductase activating protein [Flavobacteriia bacterium]|nr:anaerobic ribonucleoside-triphosphate reductase activating protein [Flavobacteriia bacterium]
MCLEKAIESISPFSLLDYPDLTSCIVWFKGCNMRCSYCYNPEIIFGEGKYTFDDVYRFLKTRINLLDGVVLSGGECTMNKNIVDFTRHIKEMGFKVKLDTNGTYPDRIKQMLDENLLDFVALDFKALDYNFQFITKTKTFDLFKKSLDYLSESNIPYEIRTTYHEDLLSFHDLYNMIDFLKENQYKGNYFIQNFRNDTPSLDKLPNSNKLPLTQLPKDKIPIFVRND